MGLSEQVSARGPSSNLGPLPSEPCTHLYTEASGLGCLDSPSLVNWSWCWCGYSGCWEAGQAWSCHSCSERSEMADSGWAGVRNASEERETAVTSTHPLRCTRKEIKPCRLWPSQAVWERAHEPVRDPGSMGLVVLELTDASVHGGGFASSSIAHGCLWTSQLLSFILKYAIC